MNPIAHIDPFMTILFPAMMIFAGLPPFGAAKPVPVDTRNLTHPKRDHAWIAAAGPISNVLLAVVSIVLIRMLLSGMLPFSLLSDGALEPIFMLLRWSIVVNLILATFNLIPIPPLDGSWILSSYLSGPAEAFYRSLQPYGFLILIVLMWSGVLWSILSPRGDLRAAVRTLGWTPSRRILSPFASRASRGLWICCYTSCVGRRCRSRGIPLAQITGEYLETLEFMAALDLEPAGEFLEVAATLLRLKARALLPQPERPEDPEAAAAEEAALLQQLVEHQVVRMAAQRLRHREEQAAAVWFPRRDGSRGG